MKHKPYPKYKPSGIDWIGDIPEGWLKKRIKYISKVNSDTLPEDTDEIFEFYYIDIGNVTLENGFSRGEKITFSEAPSRARRIAKEGDTIVSTVRTYLKAIAYIDDSESELIASTGFAVVRPEDEIDRKYLYYSLCSERVVHTISAISVGVSYPAINASDLACIFLIFPNKAEQKKIANFLDQKTAQIDDLLRKKEEMIKLLKEKRAAIINQAVTKGLDPNAKMKPSGIDWIGDIPEGWQVRKLAYISDIVLGKMLTPNDKGAYYLKYYLRAKNLGWLSANVDDVKEMWFSGRELKIYRLQKNDLLVSEGGEVGRTCIWNDELEECYIQNSVNRVRVKKRMIAKYFSYQFYALGYGGYFESIVNRISIGHLTKEKLSSVKFLVPPEEAQQQIADFLDQRTAEIDGLIQKIESAIAKLREYRSSLITAAVTGKIDVRGAVKC